VFDNLSRNRATTHFRAQVAPHDRRGLAGVRLLPDNAWRCRFVSDSAHFAAVSYRAVPESTATAEQTWSKHGDGHVPNR
jgi:hypothetical protein